MSHQHKFYRRDITPVVIVVSIVVVTVLGCGNQDRSNPLAQPALDDTIAANQSSDGFSPFVDKDGTISLPENYKQKWTHLGSWAVAKEEGATVHEMHDVYTQPETISSYNKTGEFPDGTVLVKEVRHTNTDELTTGQATWSTDIKIWFMMVKDREGRFSDNDHWGDGWGWALFEAKDPTKNISAGYDSSCLSCHVPVEDADWVYTYGYPDLKQPKQQ
jgi:hypothetical protein